MIYQHRRNASAGVSPSALLDGEIAINTTDGVCWYGTGSGVDYVSPYVSATDRILGRSSAGAGPAEEITCTAAGRALLDDADAAAQLATLGAAPTASPTFTGTVTIPDGSAESPSVTWSGDTDTGLYRHAANTVGITCGGVTRMRLSGVGMFVEANAFIFGGATSRSAGPAVHPAFQFEGTSAGAVSYQCICGSTTDTVSPQIILARHRGGVGDSTAVIDGDRLGVVRFNAGDGTDCVSTAALIECRVDGTPGSNDMPGRLMLSTTADGSAIPTERLRIDSRGNVLIAGTASPTAGVGTLCLFNATAPTGSVTNGVVLYSEDVSSSAELKVRDEAGNVTTLSPHNFALIPGGPSEPMAWAYYSERDGHRINVDMLRLARLVERLTGEKLVYEEAP